MTQNGYTEREDRIILNILSFIFRTFGFKKLNSYVNEVLQSCNPMMAQQVPEESVETASDFMVRTNMLLHQDF